MACSVAAPLLLGSQPSHGFSFCHSCYSSLVAAAVPQWPGFTFNDFRPYLKHAEVVMVKLIGAIWDSPGYLRHLPRPGRYAMGLRRDLCSSKGAGAGQVGTLGHPK